MKRGCATLRPLAIMATGYFIHQNIKRRSINHYSSVFFLDTNQATCNLYDKSDAITEDTTYCQGQREECTFHLRDWFDAGCGKANFIEISFMCIAGK